MGAKPVTGIRERQPNGDWDLSSSEPRAIVQVRLVPPGAKPGAGGSYRTVHLPAVNQPSSVLEQMLEEQGLAVLEIAEVAVVCQACGHAADGLIHTGC